MNRIHASTFRMTPGPSHSPSIAPAHVPRSFRQTPLEAFGSSVQSQSSQRNCSSGCCNTGGTFSRIVLEGWFSSPPMRRTIVLGANLPHFFLLGVSIGDFLDAKAETLFSSADSSPHRGRAALVCRGSAPCSRRLAVACCRRARRGAP
jgi:hypothetical protein